MIDVTDVEKGLIDDDVEQKPEKLFIKGIGNKVKRQARVVDKSRRSLSAASISNVRTLLTKDQMLDCADIYANNGIVRAVVDKLVWFILGERTKFTIEPNDELMEGMSDEESIKLEEEIKNSDKYKQLRKDILRINKRVELHDRLTKFLTNVLVFGRAFLEVKRFPIKGESDNATSNSFLKFGEPSALRPLTPLRVVDLDVDEESYKFEGLFYNFGVRGKERVRIDTSQLISGWYDDNNVFDNTYYSGMSLVWSVLSAAQTLEVINDENLPEHMKSVAEGFGFIYTGSSKENVSTQIKNELKNSTFLIHNYKELRPDMIDIAEDPEKFIEVINGLSRYITQCLNLPLFLVFEDTANFATANQVMQTFKVSTLNRYRTWLQGILEKCWYDPILADFFDCELEDVISQEVKIKPIFEDINFETRLDVIQADNILFNDGVMDEVDMAKDINRPDLVNKLEQKRIAIGADETESIKEVKAMEQMEMQFDQNKQLQASKMQQQAKQQKEFKPKLKKIRSSAEGNA